MNKEHYILLIDWFDRYVNRYRDAEGVLPAALELKYTHSRRVAENARLISFGLELTPAEILLAEGCGLVHDIGRFLQYERYGSFQDADTLDHGLAGRKTLEAEGAPSLFEEGEWARIACAVEFHNRKTDDLPDDLSCDSRRLLNIVRDSDKLDIMELVLRSVVRDGFRELSGMLPHIRPSRELTPGVMEEILKMKTVSIDRLRTITDFLVMLASWFYDFNFSSSRQIVASRNLIGRLQKELPDSQSVRKLLADINNEINILAKRT